MSVLTKIFVVLVTVCSIALAALTVAFVARTENYDAKAKAEANRASQAEATATYWQTERAAAEDRNAQTVSALTAEKTNLAARVTELENARAKAEGDVLAEKARNAQSAADLSRLAGANDQYAKLIEQLNKEVGERRGAYTDLQTKYIEVTDRLRERDTQVDTLSRELRLREEQIAALDRRVQELTEMVVQLGGNPSKAVAAPGGVEGGSPIRATVTQVRTSPSGEALIAIGVGSDAGVKENMKFYVQRGSTYLGTMVISSVQPGSAVGRLTQAGQGRVAVGDEVFTGRPGAGGANLTGDAGLTGASAR